MAAPIRSGGCPTLAARTMSLAMRPSVAKEITGEELAGAKLASLPTGPATTLSGCTGSSREVELQAREFLSRVALLPWCQSSTPLSEKKLTRGARVVAAYTAASRSPQSGHCQEGKASHAPPSLEAYSLQVWEHAIVVAARDAARAPIHDEGDKVNHGRLTTLD
ncbi:uncharacterized protein PITG_03786 [Phytophthora infestans T30-4]|uniref:Uncharacterized protein n=2 Tax=Phytophthora infestans TaxID=4787 RepID=D0MYI4_PHYIT|nr:uncharacterized protein PITG_03786 [Phytophthora infestans T30-4]EEY66232.1 hypothetical protein PITG_03786 [Phytophthora infestans T30-4]KAF4135816.1 hypothetical protein GN958_ATG15040 [Phytophthora infestans]|eukprot:XP_002906831.1 hypothetical protein PITG_03786 [Phytophthora infestans T30-4]